MKKLRIGGVPEHFNRPWLDVVREASRHRLKLEWRDYPGGSGAMGEALDAGEIELAMLLTEGAVAGIANGGRYRILGSYTRSPLIWGIHVPAQAPGFQSIDDIRGARYAISRHGSGSHLMSFAHARSRSWPTEELELVVVGDLSGAVRAFAEGRADVLLWEKFMTQPLVESGQFRRVGEFVAAWPAFVVCVGEAAWQAEGEAIRSLVAAVLERAGAIKEDPGSAARLAAHYGLREADVVEWLATTRWASEVGIDAAELDEVIGVLAALALVPRDTSAGDLILA